MKLEFKITEQDFLDFQLFTASKSKRIKKRKRNSWFFLTFIALALTVFSYFKDENGAAIYFGIVTLIFGLFFPYYLKWKYKRHYKTHINDNFSKRFGQPIIIEISDNSIYSKDKTGEGKIKLTEVEKVDETNMHFFVKISSGHSLIIPKNSVENPMELRLLFEQLGLKVNNELNWKW